MGLTHRLPLCLVVSHLPLVFPFSGYRLDRRRDNSHSLNMQSYLWPSESLEYGGVLARGIIDFDLRQESH